ncbi:MAG: twin-arginine translocase subunit TatC [Kordiimonadaceae bacterium]|jgi:sec-independent protein translocase protein TatC|nr:twin-arginine translocase subunit TatC [Kordiimonadaceae bacterium]MBT6032164.1 twin-arginine translocase subunit TatC [Kordiimonadaceae bacterium]
MSDQETTDTPEEEIEESSAPLLDHLIELRSRLIWSVAYIIVAFGVCLVFADPIYNFLAQPFVDVAIANGKEPTMIFTGLQDKFFVNIRLSFYVALCVTFPMVAMQIWKFVAPGLYNNERRAFLPFLLATPILFTLGAAMAYYIVIPRAWGFFMSFEVGVATEMAGALKDEAALQIQSLPAVKEYLGLTILLMFAFALSFQLPVLLLLLAKVGFVTADGLAGKRKYAIVGAFVFAMFMTPPDPLSQVLLALPIIVLYEISILIIRLTTKEPEEVDV